MGSLDRSEMTLGKVESALSIGSNHHHENGFREAKRNGAFTVPLCNFGNELNPYTHQVLAESARYILDRIDTRPKIGIICGSGLGGLAETLEEKIVFPYDEIPHFPTSTVAGHAGRMIVGQLAKVSVICMQGRFHYFEGYPMWKCAMPVRVLKLMGIEILIVTNAAGGLHPEYKVGDVMIIKDHINFPGFAGLHPLRGPNDDRFGTRFPPLNNAYDRNLRTLAKQVAADVGMTDCLREGVYAMVGGPNFETVAEVKVLRMLGVDAVGMSTIPEVITATHCGIRVFSFSLITNEAIGEYDVEEEVSHEEVMALARKREEDLKKLMSRLVPCFQNEISQQQNGFEKTQSL